MSRQKLLHHDQYLTEENLISLVIIYTYNVISGASNISSKLFLWNVNCIAIIVALFILKFNILSTCFLLIYANQQIHPEGISKVTKINYYTQNSIHKQTPVITIKRAIKLSNYSVNTTPKFNANKENVSNQISVLNIWLLTTYAINTRTK